MSEMGQAIALGVYALGMLVIIGIYYEVHNEWPDWWPGVALWPFVPVVLLAIGVIWLLLWVGRGPVRLVRWFRARGRLPRAEVRRR